LSGCDLTLAIADGGPFDAVFSTGAFHWIRDHEQLYRRIFCLLLPGGWLVEGLGELGVRFVRMNVIARRSQPGLTGPVRLRG
jgi:trans-aconitate methyltransferase